MKRLRTILLFLLLGAVVNMGVTWGLAVGYNRIYDELSSGEVGRASAEGDSWEIIKFCYFGTTRLIGIPSTKSLVGSGFEEEYIPGLLPSWSRLNYPPTPLSANVARKNGWEWDTVYRTEIARGWPLRSFTCTHFKSYPDEIIHTKDGILLHVDSNSPLSRITLPLRPIWTGFALNTFLFSVLLGMLFALRRFTRRRRGLCVKCAYNLKGAEHEVCPECGYAC